MKLPANYDEARQAIAKCERVDECAKWADQAAALRAYAYQMKDHTLEDRAKRIRARAIRRGGELLAKAKAKPGGDQKSKRRLGPRSISQKKAAAEAGLTPAQAKDMLRLARINGELFERQIESANPPSVKELARQAVEPRLRPPDHREEYLDWTHAVRHLAALPACGLDVLVARGPYGIKELLEECTAALDNLRLWKRLMEKSP